MFRGGTSMPLTYLGNCRGLLGLGKVVALAPSGALFRRCPERRHRLISLIEELVRRALGFVSQPDYSAFIVYGSRRT